MPRKSDPQPRRYIASVGHARQTYATLPEAILGLGGLLMNGGQGVEGCEQATIFTTDTGLVVLCMDAIRGVRR